MTAISEDDCVVNETSFLSRFLMFLPLVNTLRYYLSCCCFPEYILVASLAKRRHGHIVVTYGIAQVEASDSDLSLFRESSYQLALLSIPIEHAILCKCSVACDLAKIYLV